MDDAVTDNDAIVERLAQMDDADQRAALLDSLCSGDSTKRSQIVELLKQRDRSLNPADLPTKPPSFGVTAAHSNQLIGRQLGRYTIVEQLGEGGMGVVYRARQDQPVKRQVAIKVTRPGFDSPEMRARFQIERQALALMDHDNIARVLDAGTTDDGRLYFVMDLVCGTPITEYCDRQQRSTRQRIELLILVCKAIQHAHQKGIVHRDIKPSNVLIVEVDGVPVPKVIDFGLAKGLEQKLSAQTLQTQYGQVLGTIEYMSPEQASFSGTDVDTRSDVYSLGALLYELLTASTPLGRERLHELELDQLLKVIRDEDPLKPSQRLSLATARTDGEVGHDSVSRRSDSNRIRGDLDLIALKALAKDRDRRYESPAALARDLQRFLNDEPVVARAPSALYLMYKFAKRHRALVGGIAASSIAAAVGIAASTYFAISASRAAQLAERQAERAQNQRDIALNTLQDVVFQIQVPLAQIPAARGVQKEMLEGAIDGLKRMADALEDDWASNRVMMIAFEDMGDIFFGLGPDADKQLEVDHRELAKQQFLRALAIADEHLRQYPDGEFVLFDSYFVRGRLAMADGALGNIPGARKYRSEANEFIETLAARNYEQYAGELFVHYFAASGLGFLAGDLEAATEWAQKGIALAEEVAAKSAQLKEPIQPDLLDELKLRRDVFALLPRVYMDETVALRQPPRVRNRLLIDRAKHFIQQHDVHEAVRSLESLLDTEQLFPQDYYGAACRYAQCATIVLNRLESSDPTVDQTEFDDYCVQAMELLRQAKATGYFTAPSQALSQLNRDPDLDPLRDLADFEALLAEFRR